jgi:hypothetical protein
MKKKSYSDLLKDPRWQKKRLEILQRDGWKCQKCGDDEETLHVHHLSYTPNTMPWEYGESNYITLCGMCHGVISNVPALNESPISLVSSYKMKWVDGDAMIIIAIKGLCFFAFNNNSSGNNDIYGIEKPERVKELIDLLNKSL